MEFPPFRIYRVRQCDNSYVEPLRFKPLRITPKDWKNVQFEWFRKSSLKVPLVVASEDSPGTFWKELQTYDGRPESIAETPIPTDEKIRANATLGDRKITIDTSKPGHPLWIKVSYHPDWRITEGAGELYLASPAFMLLVPQTSRVVLTFDTGAGVYLWGKILSLFTVLVFIFKAILTRTTHLTPFSTWRPHWLSGRKRGAGPENPGRTESRVPRTLRIGAKRKVLRRAGPAGRYYSSGNIDAGSS